MERGRVPLGYDADSGDYRSFSLKRSAKIRPIQLIIMQTLTTKRLLTVFAMLLSLVACAPFVKDGQQGTASNGVILQAGQTIGQTFLARDGGLQAIEVFLRPETTGTGEIRMRLRENHQSSTDLAVSTLAVQSVTAPGWVRFDFSPSSDSRGKDYYFLLELQGTGRMRVGAAPGDTYLDGALYHNESPLDAQMTFRLVYESGQLFLGLLAQVGSWFGILAAAFFLLILPGWALLALFWREWDLLPWGAKLGLAAGVSLALYPLLILWTDMIGLHLGALYAWLPAVAATGALIWRNRAWRPGNISEAARAWRYSENAWSDTAFVALMALIFVTRFWVIRSLDVPMWGDSYQHTMMAQLLVDHGGLFNSWQPYAELQTLTYHFGFHTIVAVFHWFSGLDLPQSVLWTGQILNVLAVIALYPLAARIGGNRWAGVVAVLVAGLLSPMPMYYVNWGRYTQLAGQVILPGAIFLVWTALESKTRDWRSIGLVWLTLAGLALTHYLVSIFAGLFFVAFFLLHLQREKVRTLFVNITLLLTGVMVLFLPWLVHVFLGKLPTIFAYYVTAPTKAASTFLQDFNAIGDIYFYLPMTLWVLLFLCLAWGFWRREKSVALVGLWWFLNLLATNPQWLRLPGQGVITNLTLFIASYIPAGVLIGAGFGWLHRSLQGKFSERKWVYSFLLLLLVTSIGLWSTRQRLDNLQVISGALVTRPDIRAAKWIQENTPKNARFLVNSFFAYGDTVIVGSDGGWWLPLLAERQTTLPPLTYGSEQGPRADYILWIDALTSEIQNKGITHPDVLALLRERGVTHVYVGQRQGRVNYAGPHVLNPDELISNPFFHLIYHQDRVWIFEVLR